MSLFPQMVLRQTVKVNLIKLTPLVCEMQSAVCSRICCIEGNIACGKSTILDHLLSKKNKSLICIQEPVNEWSNMSNGYDLLKLFYQESDKWSYAFENLVQLSRMRSFYDSRRYIAECESGGGGKRGAGAGRVFVERSIFSSFNVFARNSFDEQRLNQVEYDILKAYYDFFVAHNSTNKSSNDENEHQQQAAPASAITTTTPTATPQTPLSFIYIRTSPEVCYERLKRRDRSSELGINLDYLIKINAYYEKWIESVIDAKEASVKIINGNLSKELVLAQLDDIVNEASN